MASPSLQDVYRSILWTVIISVILKKAECQTNIRLVPGDVNCMNCGRLEVLINGKWGTVCSNLWTESDATVACRQLFFPSGGKPAKYAAFGEGQGPIHMSHVDCYGNETSLLQCGHRGGASCHHEDDAGVVCESPKTAGQTGAVRLLDGSGPTSGRVTIQYHGVWGTVCRDGWNIWNAKVVCRSLGYCGGSSVVHDHGAFGLGSGPVWLTDVNCDGSELSLDRCRHAGWADNSCDHGYDVGVVCDLCPTDTVRLQGGQTNSAGIVTISNNGVWGTMCSEKWSDEEARVVCKSLGFADGLAVEADNFTSQTGSIWLSGVDCMGSEKHITECYHDNRQSGGWGSNDCRHYQDVAVLCVNQSLVSTTALITDLTTVSQTVPSSGKDSLAVAEGMSKPWIIITVLIIVVLLTVITVVIIYIITRVRASKLKHNMTLPVRSAQNDYLISEENGYLMPENNAGKQRDSDVYEEIEEEGDGQFVDIQQPNTAHYRPRTSQERYSKYKRKADPLPDLPEDNSKTANSARNNTNNSLPHNANRMCTKGMTDTHYLEPTQLRC